MTCVGLPGEEVLCLQNLYRFVPEKRLLAELEKAELVALVNFGEQPAMLRLWRELMERLLPRRREPAGSISISPIVPV